MHRLALLAALVATPLHAASYDCSLPHLAPDERMICDDRVLNDLDVEMAVMFRMLTGLFGMGMRGSMQDDQRDWLSQRQSCGADRDCLEQAYRNRIGALQAIYDGIDRPI